MRSSRPVLSDPDREPHHLKRSKNRPNGPPPRGSQSINGSTASPPERDTAHLSRRTPAPPFPSFSSNPSSQIVRSDRSPPGVRRDLRGPGFLRGPDRSGLGGFSGRLPAGPAGVPHRPGGGSPPRVTSDEERVSSPRETARRSLPGCLSARPHHGRGVSPLTRPAPPPRSPRKSGAWCSWPARPRCCPRFPPRRRRPGGRAGPLHSPGRCPRGPKPFCPPRRTGQ